MSAKWWTLMMASRTPKGRKRESVISRRVRPAISTSALGRLAVSGRKRVPRPAARIMAFIRALPSNRPALEGGPYKGKVEERFLAAQVDRFAGANREEKNRPAPLGMTVGICGRTSVATAKPIPQRLKP